MITFVLFFTAGVWWLQQQAALPDLVWVQVLCAAPLVWLLTRLAAGQLRVVAHLVWLFCAVGMGFFYAAWSAECRLADNLATEWQGKDIEVVGVVANLPRTTERGQGFVLDVERTLTPRVHVPQHIYLSTYRDKNDELMAVHAGERWQLTVRLKRPHGSRNPQGFDFEAWALENQLRAVGYVSAKGINQMVDVLAEGYRITAWREDIAERIRTALGDAPYTAVLIALAIGEQRGIPADQWQIFTRTGINHLVSISGLHITLLSSMGFFLCYHLWRRSTWLTLHLPARKAAALFGLLVALGYAWLAGFAVPAQRTVYMVGTVAMALWLNRRFSIGQILSLALLVVLLFDPWAVLAPGFWLSFSAVALIFFVTAHRLTEVPKNAWVRWVWQPVREYFSVQWAMTIGLIPLLLAMFQQVSLVSPLANDLAVPVVSLLVVPLTLLGTALPWDAPLWAAHALFELMMRGLTLLNALPQAVWTQHAPPVWSIVLGMVGVVWMLLPRGFPARWLGMIWLLPMFLNAPDAPAVGNVRLVVFDVGQGLAVAVQTQQHALLYDAGADFSSDADSGNRVIVPNLRAMGIAELDGMVLSHDDNDHVGGADSVLQAMPVTWIRTSMSQAAVQADFERDGQPCFAGQHWEWDGVQFEFLHPAQQDIADLAQGNEQSCVLRISSGNQHILLVGDIEKQAEARLLAEHAAQLPATLLVAPHHGSKTSSGEAFVAKVLPEYVVFTVGYRNRFGHPRAEVLQRYLDSGAEVLRSDQHGAILVNMDAQGLSVERYRQTHRRYWTDFTE